MNVTDLVFLLETLKDIAGLSANFNIIFQSP
jgi:hypothetical protein